jgi:hypothetical protein
MTSAELLRDRLRGQGLVGLRSRSPLEVLRSMAAIQAQDYAAAKWALGLRSPGTTDGMIEVLFSEGRLLRTHVLRPTWHFVAPEDIRWLLRLTADRVNARNAPYYRKSELSDEVFRKSASILERELGKARFLSRERIAASLRTRGIQAEGMRLALLLMKAELDGLICSGPREGLRFTYALLDDRVGVSPKLPREEALAELAMRYFSTRGPATLKDFSWWSGLSLADARRGVDLSGGGLVRENDGDLVIRDGSHARSRRRAESRVLLLPNYDEYLVAYTDRGALVEKAKGRSSPASSGASLGNAIVIDGKIRGAWKLRRSASPPILECEIRSRLSAAEEIGLRAAGRRLAWFLETDAIEIDVHKVSRK